MIGSLCTGYGGLDMAALSVLGGELAWVADPDPGAAAILAYHHPTVPNHGDITTADWYEAEPVDMLTAGFPCQTVSLAGTRAGLVPGAASGLWAEVARAVRELRPSLVVIENVQGLLSAKADRGDVGVGPGAQDLDEATGRPLALRALGAVLGDLAGLGFDAEWTSMRASDVGAAHQRTRVFVLAWPAHPEGPRLAWPGLPGRPARHGAAAEDPDRAARRERRQPAPGQAEGGRARADARGRGGTPAADPDPGGRRTHQPLLRPGQPDPGRGPAASPGGGTDWGPYAPAVRRWSAVLGRPAPGPTDAAGRLNPVFVEWMMGLPPGHVTDVPDLSRTAQLKALGNGVLPDQAAAALRLLLERATAPAAGEVAA
ncbi:DNA cytosine methyltransferase [Kitasatospora sp. RG8]|uniref:DNA cytosine methyltransferase n=1 Tax=Kitasatospora sp. RG8 TaxID=2820815 RepID=UPI0027DBC95B|nr:DNA cytosine methyltransferase [Kitasatospora sp. RG8]